MFFFLGGGGKNAGACERTKISPKKNTPAKLFGLVHLKNVFPLERKRRNIDPNQKSVGFQILIVSETWTFQFGCQMLDFLQGVSQFIMFLGFFWHPLKGRCGGGCTSKLTHQI